MKKIFIVGTARSGTTLLQSIVMCDDDVFSFPETHIFTKGIRRRKFKSIFTSFYVFFWVRKEMKDNFLPISTRSNKVVKKFFEYLEEKALLEGKKIILEKTPGHLNKIDKIRDVFPDAVFIHLIRKGEGNVSSLTKASGLWGGQKSYVQNYRRWVSEVFYSFYNQEKNNDVVVFYEDLLNNSESVIHEINEKCGLNIPLDFKNKFHKNTDSIVSSGETWKENNKSKEICSFNGSSIYSDSIFCEEAMKKLRKYLSD